MKRIYLILIGILIASCEQNSTHYLYEKKDPKYRQWQNARALDCTKNNKVFDMLDKYNDFSQFKVGILFKSEQKTKDDPIKVYRFMKILSIEGSVMRIGLKSSLIAEAPRIIEFHQNESEDIVGTVARGVCNQPDPLYQHSSLKSSKVLAFAMTRKSKTNDEDYVKTSEKFLLQKKIPHILFQWAGTVANEVKQDSSSARKVHELSLKIINKKECNKYSSCNFLDIEASEICNIVVDKLAYTRVEVEDRLVSFNCRSAI